jgi:hypothetical protein
MRKSYGFRTFRYLELALYHSLGKLPEPEPADADIEMTEMPGASISGHSTTGP